jgi:8-oxo-dGTP pyrophosphatase MutT (NUDIX family)
MAKKQRAGIIPYHINKDKMKMMFMKPSDPKFGGDKFQISKGLIDEPETALQAAIREGKEELGLFEGNIISINKLGIFLGTTTIFVANIEDPDMFGDPCYETGAVAWITPEQFYRIGRIIHVPIIKSAVRFIENLNAT